MNSMEMGKANFQKALLAVSQNYLENLELAPEEDVSFSPKLERKMERLLKFQRKPYRKLINTPCKRAIAACLAILLLTGTLVSCSFIREPIVAFFTGVYEKFTEFFFGEEDKETASKVIEEAHTLTYVPEGYELVESPVLTGKDISIRTVWKNQEDSKIIFSQNLFISKTTIDTEDAIIKTIDQETTIVIVQKNDQACVFWNDDIYAYKLMCKLSEDEIIKIIKSIK